MFTIFKKFFGKPDPKIVPAVVALPAAPSTPMPTIEVAHLSLAAITARFPEDLRTLLLREPEPSATVALPLPTILKQLASGSVKMSLASLQRQAHGLIKPLAPGDKRMVEVPLSEVLRHVRPSALRRRSDQRPVAVPENGFNLFGDSAHPFAVAPDDQMVLSGPAVLDLTPEMPRGLKMDDTMREQFGSASPARSQPVPAASPSTSEWKLEMPSATPRLVALPADFPTPNIALNPAPAAPAEGPTLSLPLASLATTWPTEIRLEIESFDRGTNVALPMSDVSVGLTKGRVVFTWGQIRAALDPPPATASAVAGEMPLQLPLKVVAPAYLSASKKPKAERKSLDFDAAIPALFSDGRPPQPASAPASVEVPPEPAAEANAAPAVAPVAAPIAAPDVKKVPETVGEIFAQPHKRDWTPAEIVAGTIKLAGVAGAVVALQEGLQVAAALPDGVKSEVVAAFLPQIFARLNQYAGEMRLGEVDDLLFTTHGAHCQIYRLGYVYFAVLGKPGEALPWHELRLISDELARQTHR